MPMLYATRRYFQPLLFQGNLRKKRYFEGWYFKHVSADTRSVLAFIPGISLSPRGSRSFVQLIDGASGATRWFSYPLEAFSFSRRGFEIRVGPNRFGLDGLEAHLEDEEGVVDARLHMRLIGMDAAPSVASAAGG